MKKMIAMILALVAALSLCACGGQQSAPEPQEPTCEQPQITTQSTTTEFDDVIIYPAMEPYLGTWVLAQEKADYTEKTITFNPDGTAQYNGAKYTWKLDPGEWLGSIWLNLVSVNDPADTSYHEKSDHITTYTTDDGTIYLYHDDGFFFHQDYLAQFEKVTLTAENICDYLEVVDDYTYTTDDLGRLSHAVHSYSTRFAEGLGLASWCVGEMTHVFSTYDITFYTEAGTEKMGNLIKSYEQTELKRMLNIPDDMEYRDSVALYFDDQGESCKEITMMELIGADPVIGVAYVPKN